MCMRNTQAAGLHSTYSEAFNWAALRRTRSGSRPDMSFSRRQLDTLPLHRSEVQRIRDDYINWRVVHSDIGLNNLSSVNWKHGMADTPPPCPGQNILDVDI